MSLRRAIVALWATCFSESSRFWANDIGYSRVIFHFREADFLYLVMEKTKQIHLRNKNSFALKVMPLKNTLTLNNNVRSRTQ